MNAAEQKAKEIISKQTLEQLLDQWELTNVINDKHISIVRGWLMEELEKRNPEAFNKWLDDYSSDEDLRKYMIA